MSINISKHVKQNRNGDILETPEGWIQYWRLPNGIYIDDLEVYNPGQQSVLRLAGAVEAIAKEEGRKYLYTNLHPSIDGTARMLHIVSKFGFLPTTIDDVIIVLRKDL